MNRTVFVFVKKKYLHDEIDALEYAKRYGEHLLAVKIQKWRNGQIAEDQFMGDLMGLAQNNQDAVINTRTE